MSMDGGSGGETNGVEMESTVPFLLCPAFCFVGDHSHASLFPEATYIPLAPTGFRGCDLEGFLGFPCQGAVSIVWPASPTSHIGTRGAPWYASRGVAGNHSLELSAGITGVRTIARESCCFPMAYIHT